MANYLDPKNDLTFKRVFGEHKHLCMSLINSMIPLAKPIVGIEYQTGELVPVLTDILKNTVVDVRCTDAAGREFLVEMQLDWDESFKSRVLFNASKAYVMNVEKGQQLKLLKPVYALNFVNDIFEKSQKMKDEYFHHYKIVNIKDTRKQIKGLEFLFVELPKFKPRNRAERKLHELWLRFLTEIDEETEKVPDEMLEKEHIREAIGYMERSAYTKEELDRYYQWRVNAWSATAMLENARNDGEAIGLEKGEAIGLEKGRKELAEERQKAEKEIAEKDNTIARLQADKIATARKMLRDGISIENVCKYTGLPEEEIKQIIHS
jgi:predicted transposase/invertase (TIGR01784 family)